MKNLIIFFICLSYLSNSFANQSCQTTGFREVDGHFIPVVECTGILPSLNSINQFGGSSYWGLAAQNQAAGHIKSKDIYKIDYRDSSQPPRNKSSSTAPSQPQSMPVIVTTPQISITELISEQMSALKKSLMKSQTALNDFVTTSTIQNEQRVNAGAQAMAGMMRIVDRIHQNINAQTGLEESSYQNALSEHNKNSEATEKSQENSVAKVGAGAKENIFIGNVSSQKSANDKFRENLYNSFPQNNFGDMGRSITNAAYATAITETDPQKQGSAVSALAMTQAASDAYAGKDIPMANSYLYLASQFLDVALGFVPFAASVNDLTQIGFGILTGRSYSGDEMSGTDYVLRSLGVVLGIFPAAYFGKTIINQTVLRGAQVIKNNAAYASMANALLGAAEHVGDVLKIVGALVPSSLGEIKKATETSHLVPGTVSHVLDVLKRFSAEDASAFKALMTNQALDLTDRWQIINSFKVGSIKFQTMSEGDKLYRWSTNGNIGRFLSPTMITDANMARSLLALPEVNTLLHLDEYTVFQKARVIFGEVAPNFGQAGGGLQVFIPNPNDIIKSTKRLK